MPHFLHRLLLALVVPASALFLLATSSGANVIECLGTVLFSKPTPQTGNYSGEGLSFTLNEDGSITGLAYDYAGGYSCNNCQIRNKTIVINHNNEFSDTYSFAGYSLNGTFPDVESDPNAQPTTAVVKIVLTSPFSCELNKTFTVTRVSTLER